jgi:hypothetical protein
VAIDSLHSKEHRFSRDLSPLSRFKLDSRAAGCWRFVGGFKCKTPARTIEEEKTRRGYIYTHVFKGRKEEARS